MAAATATLEVVKLGRALGAEIRGVDLSKPIDDTTLRFVETAWAANLPPR